MKPFTSLWFSAVAPSMLVLVLLIAPDVVQAAIGHATACVESTAVRRQALAFPPSDLWFHASDSIAWALSTPAFHTVTFVKPDASPWQELVSGVRFLPRRA